MTIDLDRLKNLEIGGKTHAYGRHDARLYALSIGFGSDPLAEPELDFVTDCENFKVVPTMACIFAGVIGELTNACELAHPELALHGEQRLEIFEPLPDCASLSISGSIPAIFDRGPDKGAEIHMTAEATLRNSSSLLYRATYVTIARGDGGFGGPQPVRGKKAGHIPDCTPNRTWEYRSRRNQALYYSLNGDPNPIHTRPEIARLAGFDKPIMHGLGTYGIACRAVLETYCGFETARLRSFDVRFSAPVYPGETIAVEMWRLKDGVAFQAKVRERGVTVLKNGYARIGD